MKRFLHTLEMDAFWCALFSVLVVAPGAGKAATYYVDGGCPSSGTGTSLDCGASGPFKTINEGITALSAGDTLNIRGVHAAHGTCPGTNGLYNDGTINFFGTGDNTYPGKALLCTTGSPCFIQGCPAAACGSDETPTITGMAQRTDWTSAGGGVYWRTSEQVVDTTTETARLTCSGGSTPNVNCASDADCAGGGTCVADYYDPEQILQGADHANLTNLQYQGDNITTPNEGYWSYEIATHKIWINPIGTGDPNSAPATAMWVPNVRRLMAMLYGDPPPAANANCPDTSCPISGHLSFKRINWEGSRWMGIQFYGLGTVESLSFDTMVMRYVPRFFFNSGYSHNLTINNLTMEKGGQGLSLMPTGDGGTFTLRAFHINVGTISNVTVNMIGTAGTHNGNTQPGYSLDCQWMPSPWNSKGNNYVAVMGEGMQIKQSAYVTVTNYTATNLCECGFDFDDSHDVTLDGFFIQGARYGVELQNFTPDGAGGALNFYNDIVRNGRIDNAGFNDGGAVRIDPMPQYCSTVCGTIPSPYTTCSSKADCPGGGNICQPQLCPGEFGAQIYNLFITQSSYAGISVDTADKVSIWNNSIYGSKPSISVAPYGIKLMNTVTNSQVENNIVSNIGMAALEVGVNAEANTFNYDLLNGTFTCNGSPNQGAVQWGVTSYDPNSYYGSGGTCYTSLAAFQAANPTVEVHAISANPLFVNTSASPPDLHIQSSSPAKDAGLNLGASFTTDIDGQARPYGPAWDIGADEYWGAGTPLPAPTLLQVVPAAP